MYHYQASAVSEKINSAVEGNDVRTTQPDAVSTPPQGAKGPTLVQQFNEQIDADMTQDGEMSSMQVKLRDADLETKRDLLNTAIAELEERQLRQSKINMRPDPR